MPDSAPMPNQSAVTSPIRAEAPCRTGEKRTITGFFGYSPLVFRVIAFRCHPNAKMSSNGVIVPGASRPGKDRRCYGKQLSLQLLLPPWKPASSQLMLRRRYAGRRYRRVAAAGVLEEWRLEVVARRWMARRLGGPAFVGAGFGLGLASAGWGIFRWLSRWPDRVFVIDRAGPESAG